MRLTQHRTEDGRLRLVDGPIDLIVFADGSPDAVLAAEAAAVACAAGVLDALCAELPLLRAAGRGAEAASPAGRLMQRAVWSMPGFITPMAAVAGAVAEIVLAAMIAAAPELARTYVNNGGDIALHLAPGQALRIGLARPGGVCLHGAAMLGAADPARGVATSGWPGRSFSLGIADAATVIARTATVADAAATVVANAIDLPGHPAITRVPARALAPDSDLGDLPVTRAVAPLSPDDIAAALERGAAIAADLCARGLIAGAALALQGATRLVGGAAVALSR